MSTNGGIFAEDFPAVRTHLGRRYSPRRKREGLTFLAENTRKEERNERNGGERSSSPGNGRDLKGFLASI